jgi:hypothetical protein
MVPPFLVFGALTMNLDEFAAQHQPTTHSWCDDLPAEVQESIITTDCSVRVVVMWLKSQGYENASTGKVDLWRRGKRIEREQQSR